MKGKGLHLTGKKEGLMHEYSNDSHGKLNMVLISD